MGKAMARALLTITSLKIRDALLMELARLMEDRPKVAGWQGFADVAPDEHAMALAMSSTIPLPLEAREA